MDFRGRLLSQSAPGAQMWTTVAGGHGLDLRTDVYRESCLRAIGLRDFFPVEGLCGAPCCASKPKPMTPGHRRTCRNFHTSRHDFVANVLLSDVATEAGVGTCSREDGGAFLRVISSSPAGVGDEQLAAAGRADILVRHSTALSTGDAELNSKHWIIDVGFGDPAASTEHARDRACDRAGYVAANIEVSKHFHYRSPGTARVRADAAAAAGCDAAGAGAPPDFPVWAPSECLYHHETHVLRVFAIETHGRLGEAAVGLLWGMATHASGGPEGDVAERGRLFRRWRLLISCAVTRAVSVQAVMHPGRRMGGQADVDLVRAQIAARRAAGPVLAGLPLGPAGEGEGV
jgi:hypothetical protein